MQLVTMSSSMVLPVTTALIRLADAIAADDGNPQVDDLAAAPPATSDTRTPAGAYLARLGPSSRRVMHASLVTLAHLSGVGRIASIDTMQQWPFIYPWHRLRYAHTLALRERLQQPIFRPRAPGARGRPPVDVLAPATIQRHLAALTGVLKECWRLELMGVEDYHRAIDLPPVRGERAPAGRALTPGEIHALLATCAADPRPIGRRDQAVIAILYGGGLRRSEVTALELGDYDPASGAVTIRAAKGNKDRTAYLPCGARETLAVWLRLRASAPQPQLRPDQPQRPLFVSFHNEAMTGRPFDEESLHAMLAQRCLQAGVAPCRPHDLRRTFIGDLLTAGVDIAIVQRLVGHADPGTTTRYDRRPDAAKARAVERLHVPFIESRCSSD